MKSYIRPSGIANAQLDVIDIYCKIVATVAQDGTSKLATSILPMGPGSEIAILVTTGITQTQVDALLSSTAASDVLATAFGGTRLGTDMAGFIINLEGQVRELVSTEVSLCAAAKGTVVNYVSLPTGSALADADAASATFEKSAAGNVYGSITHSGLDSASAGYIRLRLNCRLK